MVAEAVALAPTGERGARLDPVRVEADPDAGSAWKDRVQVQRVVATSCAPRSKRCRASLRAAYTSRRSYDALVAGRANKTVAHELGTSPRTVETYRAAIMERLRACSFAEVVRIELAGGIGVAS